MEEVSPNNGGLVDSSKHVVQRLLAIGQNRLELLSVELQEERERLLSAIFLVWGVAILGLLAMLALNAAIVVLLWDLSPVAVLLVLAVLYGTSAFFLYRRLAALLRNWKTLSATLDQLQKDRQCLGNKLD
jgi:uncharacterized membrane protein YqjE